MGVGDRTIAVANFYRILMKLITKVDIRKLQEKYGLKRDRITRIHFDDAGKYIDMKLQQGGLLSAMFDYAKEPDVHVHISRLCILKHLRTGYVSVRHPGTGEKTQMAYPPLAAWRWNDITANGNGSTAEVLAVGNIVLEVMEQLPMEEIVKVIGECPHD